MAFFPYHIHHLQIDEDDLNLQWKDGCGLYLVLWWKCIAIGDLYLPRNTKPGEGDLRKLILKQISPALETYSAGKPVHTYNYKAAFLHHDFETFRQGMNEIFSGFVPGIVPPAVNISVVVCTRHGSAPLRKCLDSLLEQKCEPSEIIVVDEAPAGESIFEVVRDFKIVKYIKDPRPGLHVMRNLGAKAASGTIVAYTNDDVELHPWWTFQVNETFARSEASAMTGLVLPGELESECQQIFEKYWSFNKGFTDLLFDPYFLIRHLQEGPRVWEIGAGPNMAFRKSIFEKVGYFDERIDGDTTGQTSEMWYRILLKGGSINYNPRAIAFVQHQKEISGLKTQLFNHMKALATSALIQQDQNSLAGYKRHLLLNMTSQYLKHIITGFPFYNDRHKTLLHEVAGLTAGIFSYYKIRKHAR